MNMLKCDESCTCPLKGSCLGRRFPEFGPLMRSYWDSGDPVKRNHVLARSKTPYVPPDPELSKPGAPPPPPSGPASPRVVMVDLSNPRNVALQLANIAQVKRCPSWEATSSCGCGMNRCRLGKGRAQDNAVSYQDCFECLGLVGSKNPRPAS